MDPNSRIKFQKYLLEKMKEQLQIKYQQRLAEIDKQIKILGDQNPTTEHGFNGFDTKLVNDKNRELTIKIPKNTPIQTVKNINLNDLELFNKNDDNKLESQTQNNDVINDDLKTELTTEIKTDKPLKITNIFKPKEEELIEPKINPEWILNEDDPEIVKQVKQGFQNGMCDNTLYVTSFAKDMYEVSGKKLLQTFLKENNNKFMLICYEGFNYTKVSNNFISYDLNKSKFLREWIIKNARDIPHELGGVATIGNNPKLYDNYFNKNASRWFRKIVSLELGVKAFGNLFKHVVWIDADCYAIKPIKKLDIDKIFSAHDVIYHLGKKRIESDLGVESGIIGFKKGKGYKFMITVANKFRTAEFKKYPRWDDGWVFREVINEEIQNNNNRTVEDKIQLLDLVGHISIRTFKKHEVIPEGPFKFFFIHEKGKHNAIRGHRTKYGKKTTPPKGL